MRSGEKFRLEAELAEKDSTSVQFNWRAKNDDILSVNFWTGDVEARVPGATEVCAVIYYTYVPGKVPGTRLPLDFGPTTETCIKATVTEKNGPPSP